MAELRSLSQESGYSLGYGFNRGASEEETEKAIATLDASEHEQEGEPKETPPGLGGVVAAS